MCRKISVRKKIRVLELGQFKELLSKYSLGILGFLTDQEEARQ